MFQPNLKSKLLQPFSVVTSLLKYVFVFTTKPLLFETKKDVLFAHHHNNVIYQFVCHCDSRYVGRTSQRLQSALNNMLPGRSKTIIFPKIAPIFPMPARPTTLLKPPPMILLLDSIFWKILPVRANTVTPNSLSLPKDVLFFYLSTLPVAFIKSFQPNLCRHKEFFYSLKLIH